MEPEQVNQSSDEEKALAVQMANQSNDPVVRPDPNGGWAIAFLFLACALIGFGLFEMYGKVGYSDRVADGGAIDHLIYQMRGVAWIGIALFCALFACALLLFQRRK